MLMATSCRRQAAHPPPSRWSASPWAPAMHGPPSIWPRCSSISQGHASTPATTSWSAAPRTRRPCVSRAEPGPDQLAQFDPSQTTICLPLGPGQTPVSETWELVELSTENHNFHLHQTRFTMTGTSGVMQDNVLLGVATPDATIADQVFNNQ